MRSDFFTFLHEWFTYRDCTAAGASPPAQGVLLPSTDGRASWQVTTCRGTHPGKRTTHSQVQGGHH